MLPSGTLTLAETEIRRAHAFAGEGLIPGVLMVLVCGSTAAFGLYLLTRCAAMAPHRAASFSSLSNLTYPGLARL